MTKSFKNGKIDNEITNGDSYTRVASFRLENAEWKILDGKMRIGWDVDERTKRHAFNLITKTTEDTKSLFDFFPFENFVCFVVIKEI